MSSRTAGDNISPVPLTRRAALAKERAAVLTRRAALELERARQHDALPVVPSAAPPTEPSVVLPGPWPAPPAVAAPSASSVPPVSPVPPARSEPPAPAAPAAAQGFEPWRRTPESSVPRPRGRRAR